jgi:uncharacterized SAM-binding protein YcdF (DUF218 family)
LIDLVLGRKPMGLDSYLIALLDKTFCQAATSTLWTKVTWRIFQGLAVSHWILPLALALLAGSFFVNRWPRWQRPMRWTSILMLVSYLILGLPNLTGLAHYALVKTLPQAASPTADAIVVLGRGPALRPQRVALAARLWEAGQAPLIFASGRGDAGAIVRSLENRYDIPATALDGEPCSRTTEENAQLTAALLQPQGFAVSFWLLTIPT